MIDCLRAVTISSHSICAALYYKLLSAERRGDGNVGPIVVFESTQLDVRINY